MTQSKIAESVRTTCCQWDQMIQSCLILGIVYQPITNGAQSFLNSPQFKLVPSQEHLLFPFPEILNPFLIFKPKDFDISSES